MALNANALLTLAQAKSYLEIPVSNTDYDPFVELLINAASQEIESYCDRVFRSLSYTKIFDGNLQQQIMLPQFPVTALTSLHVDGSRVFGSDTLVASDQYGLVGSAVQLHGGVFPKGSQNVKVVFTAGYATIPADLQMACLFFVDWIYRHRNDRRIGKTSIGKAGETVGYVSGIPPEIREHLKPYVRCEFPGSTQGRNL